MDFGAKILDLGYYNQHSARLGTCGLLIGSHLLGVEQYEISCWSFTKVTQLVRHYSSKQRCVMRNA